MNKRLYKIGIVIIFIGLILIFFGFLFSERYFLFDYNVLWENSKLIMIFGTLLLILGAVFTIIGALMKGETRLQQIQKEEREVYSGICPVCHQEFETTAEIIRGYYVFNCNKCNSKLRVKKLDFYPAG